jgi:uncharacterized protein (TIGR03435 family)
MRRIAVIALVLVGFGVICFGQQPAFDAASIKENKSFSAETSFHLVPGGALTAVNVPARWFISIGFSLHPFELVNVPDWAERVRYDVMAKPAERASRTERFEMLQKLLKERFNLAFHRETRELNGFALVRLRGDKLGPAMMPSSVDCSTDQRPMPRGCDGSTSGDTTLKFVGAPMEPFITMLVDRVGAPISDETKLTGTFDINLRWTNDVTADSDLRPIDVAIQDQLGLKLERRRVKAEVFVVDRFDRPTPD